MAVIRGGVAAATLAPVQAWAQQYLFWIKFALVLIVLTVTFGTGWWVNGLRWEAKASAAKTELLNTLEKEREQYAADKARWEAQSQITATRIEALEGDKDTLLATIAGLKLTRTIKVAPNAQGECESAVLDDAFRLRWNQVVETAAASAAPDRGD